MTKHTHTHNYGNVSQKDYCKTDVCIYATVCLFCLLKFLCISLCLTLVYAALPASTIQLETHHSHDFES